MSTVVFQWSTTTKGGSDASAQQEVCGSLDVAKRYSQLVANLVDEGHVAMENDRLVIDCDGLDALQDQETVQRFVEFVEHHDEHPNDTMSLEDIKRMTTSAGGYNMKSKMSCWDQRFFLLKMDAGKLVCVAEYLLCEVLLTHAAVFSSSRCAFAQRSESILPPSLFNTSDPLAPLGPVATSFLCDLLCPTFDHAFKHPLESIKTASAHVDRFWYSKTATSPMTMSTRYLSPSNIGASMKALFMAHLEANARAYVSLSVETSDEKYLTNEYSNLLSSRQNIELKSSFNPTTVKVLLDLLFKNPNLKTIRVVNTKPVPTNAGAYSSAFGKGRPVVQTSHLAELVSALGWIPASPLESLHLCFFNGCYDESCWSQIPHCVRRLWVSAEANLLNGISNLPKNLELEQLCLFGENDFEKATATATSTPLPSTPLLFPDSLKELYLSHIVFKTWTAFAGLLMSSRLHSVSVYLRDCTVSRGANSAVLDGVTLGNDNVEDLPGTLKTLMERNDENDDTFTCWEAELNDDNNVGSSIKVTEGHAHPQLE